MYRVSKGVSQLVCCFCLAAAFFLAGNQAFAATNDAGGGADELATALEWRVSSDADVRAAVAEIKEKRDGEGLTEATLVFVNDVTFTYDKHPDAGWDSGSDYDARYVAENYFSGVEGVTLTLKSADANNPAHLRNLGATFGNTRLHNAGFSLNNGETARLFTGPMVLDNIVFDTTDRNGNVRDEVYVVAQGHKLVMTERFSSTEPLHVIGGNLGKYRRLDGMGFGDEDGIASDGSTLGWIEEPRGSKPTHLEIYGGSYGYIYAGGFNSDVDGDTFVKVALPESQKVGYVYGGGASYKSYNQVPSEGTRSTVRGDSCVQALSGGLGSIYGGSYRGYIDGNSSVTVGQPQSDRGAVYGEIYGGGDQSTLGSRSGWDWVGGNASVTVENTAHPKDDTANIFGGGFIDTINGTTEIVLNGGSNDHWVFAGGMNIGAYDQSANILNKNDEAVAAKIAINGGDWSKVYSTVETNYSSTASQEINGDVLVELNGGQVDYFGLSALQTHVLGDSILSINGGELGNFTTAISGYQYDDSEGGNTYESGKVEGKRIVNLNNSQPMRCWQIYAIDQINVNNTAPFIARGTADEGALRLCGDVNVQSGMFALTGSNELIDTSAINGTNADGTSKAKGDLTIAAGATLALNATGDGLSAPGHVNAEGSATGSGKLLAVKPSGSDWISTDMSQGDPQVGEVYIRSNSTDETAAPNTAANMVKLANSPTSRYVEYTKDASAIAPSFAHAWRIADDPDAKTVTVTFDKNGGDTEASPNEKKVVLKGGATSSTIDALPAPPTWADHEFTGWNTATNGQGDAFTEQTPVSQDITVYAQWKALTPDPTYTVTYTDGVDGEEVFVDQVNEGLEPGAATPAFQGTPLRDGYAFVGWAPEVAPTVTEDVVYVAQWQKNEPAPTFTVTYTDGVEDEEVFADQVHGGLAAGAATPPFDGAPSRDGYRFDGWAPEVAPAVAGDAIYVAQWTRLYTVAYTDGVDGEEVFADQVYAGLIAGEKTPSFDGAPSRAGYDFVGWKPDVVPTVTGDAVYEAQWQKKSDPKPPVIPDPEPPVIPDPKPPVDPDQPVDPDKPVDPAPPTEPDEPAGPDEPSDGFVPPAKPDQPSGQGGFGEPADVGKPASGANASAMPMTGDAASSMVVPFAVLAFACMAVAGLAIARLRARTARRR